MQLELGENPRIWYCLFFFLNMQNACKGRKGKSFCTKNIGHCFDMVEYRRGGGGVGGCFKTDNYPKVLVNDL